MSVLDSGSTWVAAIIKAPFVAVLFWAAAKIVSIVYESTRIDGNGEFAQSQDSVYESTLTAINLLELASSVETWILFGLFVAAIYGVISSHSSNF